MLSKKVDDFDHYYENRGDYMPKPDKSRFIDEHNFYVDDISMLAKRLVARARRFPPDDFVKIKVKGEEMVAWHVTAQGESSNVICLGSDSNLYYAFSSDVAEIFPLERVENQTALSISFLENKINDLSDICDVMHSSAFMSMFGPFEKRTKQKSNKPDRSLNPGKKESWLRGLWDVSRAYVITVIVLVALIAAGVIYLYIKY